MKSDWKRVKLGEIISIKGGFSYKGKYIGSGSTFLLGMGCVSFNETFLHSGARLYSGDCSSSFLISPGDIVLATRQQSDNLPILGLPAILPNDFEGEKVIVGTNLYKITNNSKISNQFLYWLLKNPNYQNHILARSKGTNVKMITKDDVESFEFLMPSKDERNAISNILWDLENILKLNHKIIQTLEKIAQVIFKSWFVDFKYPGHENDELVDSELGMIPEGWEVKSLGSITDVITKGTTPTTLKKKFVEEGINFIKVQSLGINGEFIENKISKIDDDTHELLKRSQIEENDILFSIAGAIGRSALMVKQFLPANTNQAIAIIRPSNEQFVLYLYQTVGSSKFQNFSFGHIVQTAQANVSLSVLSSVPILIPTYKILDNYNNLITSIFYQKNLLFQKTGNLRQTRDLLLPKLISGKIDVSDLDIDTSILYD